IAGEIGHVPVEGVHFRCNCGKAGCLETIASATGIARLAREAVLAGEATSLARIDDVRSLSALDVYKACVQGDPLALSIFDAVGTALGRQLLSAVFLLDPETIIIGGGVAAAGDYLLAPVRKAMEAGYFAGLPCPPVRAGTLGDNAGLFGALSLAKPD